MADIKTVGVIGAGQMGSGIAHVCALAGYDVFLHDLNQDKLDAGVSVIEHNLARQVGRGLIDDAAMRTALGRIKPVLDLGVVGQSDIAIEAATENEDVKKAIFRALQPHLKAETLLASNTSSISITRLASTTDRPERFIGLHFMNPVPLMKLVEVVSGLQTDAAVAQAVHALAGAWGKVAVHARSTPGFIVNRIARPYYAEALALLHEQAATPAVIDACLRGAGFRMGPCELIDLIGHDTNFAVTQSVYEANFYDKRYVPSLVQREMVAGGLYGRKSGRGFYAYADGKAVDAAPPAAATLPRPAATRVALHGGGAVAERLAAALQRAGIGFERVAASEWTGLAVDGAELRLTEGRCAAEVAAATGVRDTALFDFIAAADAGGAAPALAWTAAASASPGWREQGAPAWLQALGWTPLAVGDAPGLVVARTVAMLVNEGADAVQQGVCEPGEADTAMKLGLNYPAGPFEWLARWEARAVVALVERLDAQYRGERYRVSPWLRQRVWAEG